MYSDFSPICLSFTSPLPLGLSAYPSPVAGGSCWDILSEADPEGEEEKGKGKKKEKEEEEVGRGGGGGRKKNLKKKKKTRNCRKTSPLYYYYFVKPPFTNFSSPSPLILLYPLSSPSLSSISLPSSRVLIKRTPELFRLFGPHVQKYHSILLLVLFDFCGNFVE